MSPMRGTGCKMFVPVTVTLGKVPCLPNGRHMLSGNVQVYIRNGKKHRDSGPAEIHPSGYQAWFQNGLRHRVGGPAVTHIDKRKEYWEKGKLIKTEKE